MNDSYNETRQSTRAYNLGAWVGGVFQLLLVASYFLGLFRAFDQSLTKGAVAFVVPPYACYKGLAILWEEAEWEKDWDEKTHGLGIILIVQMGGSDNLSTKITIGEVTPMLKKWVADLPKNKRVMLEKSAIALCQATNECQRRAMRKLLQSGKIEPVSEEGVLRELVDELSNVSAFKGIYAEHKETLKEIMEELFSKLPGVPSIDSSTGIPIGGNSNRQTTFEAMRKDPIYRLGANEAWRRSFREEETYRRRTSMILKDIFGASSGLPKSVSDKSNLFE